MEMSSQKTPNDQSLLSVARGQSLLDKEEASSFTSNYSEGDNIQDDRYAIRRTDSHHTEESSIFDGLDNYSDAANQQRTEFQLDAASPSSSVEVSIQGQISGEQSVSRWNYSKLESKIGNRSCTENKFANEQSITMNNASEVENFYSAMDVETDADIERYKKVAFDQNFDTRVEVSADTQKEPTSMYGSNSKYMQQSKDQDHDAFVRSGTRLKSLLDNALRQVAIGVVNDGEVELSLQYDQEENEKDKHEEESCSGQKRKRLHHYSDDEEQKHASELAREKMAEVMVLKRELKEALEQAKAMSHANLALREASTTTSARLETLSEALRIAGEKAADARADADASQARASSLASQLKTFKTALDETKRTVQIIRAEHDDISSAARELEAKLLRTESDLNRAQKERNVLQVERGDIYLKLNDLKESQKTLRDDLCQRDDELSKLKKSLADRDNVDDARFARISRLENELTKSKSIVVELTSSASEAESTTAELRNIISALQKENEGLHTKIQENLDSASKERERLQEDLAKAENEAQKLRLKATGDEEELHKLKLDKLANEKEIAQLKNRIINLEKRLAESNALGSISPGNNTISDVSSLHSDFNSLTPSSSLTNSSLRTPARSSSSQNSVSNSMKKDHMGIPKLKAVPNVSKDSDSELCSNSRNDRGQKRSSQANCSICFRASYGVMKACQCGNPTCDLRAHSVCIAGKKPLPSVSHPGTPAPALPVILCRK